MLILQKFGIDDYANLISWVDSEEALMQFAGPGFKFPLTTEQLAISQSDENRTAFKIVSQETNLIIGHCEIYLSPNSANLGRILIGDKEQRGKGLGQQVVALLLNIIFSQLNRSVAELNVFDWNTSAIKCYEKVGFTVNAGKKFERKIKDKVWVAINMTITKKKWNTLHRN